MALTELHFSTCSSASSSSGDEFAQQQDSGHLQAKVNLSYCDLDENSLESHLGALSDTPKRQLGIQKLRLHNNTLQSLPVSLFSLKSLSELDVSNNALRHLPAALSTHLPCLTHLVLRNNMLVETDFPKDFGQLARSLRHLNLSGNNMSFIPPAVLQLTGLKDLSVGGNHLQEVPAGVKALEKLRFLYLGGNQIKQLPGEICQLVHLQALNLCNNQLTSLPDCICRLKKLRCLQLHSNKLTILPHGLIFLSSLTELSLRDNPLVARFVADMDIKVTTLLELAARVIKIHRIPYHQDGQLPAVLVKYLSSAQSCVNARCSGVYFESRVEHVKFVDFCGKYRIPLMQYLCSSRCQDDRPAVSLQGVEKDRMRRVLLG